MANTYKIREVTVTIPKIGIVSSDKEGNEFKCGEIYHINLFAMRPGWQTRTSDFDGLIVGRLDFSGYTESQISRTQKIIMPNGYELVALRVGECGRPMTWESLPVVFSDAPLSDSEPFIVKNCEVFIKDAVIGDGIVSANYYVKLNVNNDSKEHAAGMTVGVEGGQGKVVFKADRFHVNEPAKSIIENAVATSTSVKVALSDEMKTAVIDAVRESDLFSTLQANIDEQTASTIALRQVVEKAVKAKRNELKTEDTAASSNKNPELNAAPAMMATGCLSVVESTESEIEKGTLSAVLANTLHVGPPEKAMDTAIRLAKAVRAAFHELDTEDAAEN